MCEVMKVARSAEYAELSGEPARPVYNAAIKAVIGEIRERQSVLRELLALRKHVHHYVISEGTDRCYCEQCGADGDA